MTHIFAPSSTLSASEKNLTDVKKCDEVSKKMLRKDFFFADFTP